MKSEILALLIILFAMLLIIAVQVFLLHRDRKKNKNNIPVYSLLKAIPFGLGILGFLCFMMTWIESTMFGKVNFYKLMTEVGLSLNLNDETAIILGICSFSIFFASILFITGAFFQLVFKVSIKSKLTLAYDLAVGLVCAVSGFMIVSTLKSAFEPQEAINQFNIFSGFQEIFKISVGIGPYIAAIIGICYMAFVITLHIISSRKINPKSKNGKHESPESEEYKRLIELKKLLAENIITEEEFNRKKAEYLAK